MEKKRRQERLKRAKRREPREECEKRRAREECEKEKRAQEERERERKAREEHAVFTRARRGEGEQESSRREDDVPSRHMADHNGFVSTTGSIMKNARGRRDVWRAPTTRAVEEFREETGDGKRETKRGEERKETGEQKQGQGSGNTLHFVSHLPERWRAEATAATADSLVGRRSVRFH